MKKRIGSFLLALCMMVTILGGNGLTVSAAGKTRLNKTAVTLKVGDKYRLSLKNIPKNGKVTWSSTSKSKAAVSKKGVVTAKKQGKATIQAKLTYKRGGKKRIKKFSCKVTVKKKNTSVLVAYFTAPVAERSGEVDGISSASRTTTAKNYKGNTEYIAELISKETGADLFEIVPKEAYADTYDKMVQQAEKEQENDARPAMKNKIKNFSEYDTVYVGFPIWWFDMPQIMYTFFDTYDLAGKDVIPFCTHAGSGLAGTPGKIKKLEPEAAVYKGLAVYRTDVTGSDSRVKSWIKKKAK